MWIDDDIFISSPERAIAALIAPYFARRCDPRAVVAVAEDAVSYTPFNAGVLAVRSAPAAATLLRRVYELGARQGLAWKRDWEQSAMALDYNSSAEARAAYCVVPPTVLQSLFRDYGLHPSQLWRPGHFAAHLTGLDETKRRHFARCAAELSSPPSPLPSNVHSANDAAERTEGDDVGLPAMSSLDLESWAQREQLQGLLACLPASQLRAATLSGRELNKHFADTLAATRRFRENISTHRYRGFRGPWLENLWIRRFCCDSAQRAKRFGRFVPLFIQWTDLMHRSKFIYLQLRRTLDTLLRNDVLYITVSQNDDGIGLSYDQSRPGDFAADRWPNLLVASSGGVGHIPIPLIKGEVNATAAQPTFGSERALTFFAGLAGSHPVRAQIISKLQQQVDTTGWPRLKRPQAPLPLKAYIRAMDDARFVLTPRGYGRSAFAVAEVIQSGRVPFYVWDDIEWLPYRGLWESGQIGVSARYDEVENFTGSGALMQHCHAGEATDASKCLLAEQAIKKMRAGVRRFRRLFTYAGVLDEIQSFAKSAGTASRLRCEPLGPRPNTDYFKQRTLRPALRCAVEGARTRDECSPQSRQVKTQI